MQRDPRYAECPEFEDHNFEQILDWAKKTFDAQVSWSDQFTDGETVYTKPELAYWSLVWKPGFIGFDHLRSKDDEAAARKTAALFIYLWCLGVCASIADRCASAYVMNCTVRRLRNGSSD